MAAPKGHPKWGGRPKGGLNKTTLLQEERRAIFEAEVSEMFIETIKKARPEYLLDQFLGKSADKIEFKGELTTNDPALDEAAKAYATASIKRKLSGGTSEA